MIDAYGNSFYKLVSNLEDSKSICRKVALCANEPARPKRNIPGSNKCTWGPHFWCTKEAEAHNCAVSFFLFQICIHVLNNTRISNL